MKYLKQLFYIIILTTLFHVEITAQNSGFEPRLTLITLSVNDLKVSSDFYENVLGWQRLEKSTDEIFFYQLNDIMLGLLPKGTIARDANIEQSECGFKHFSLAYYTRSKKEVDDLMNYLESVNTEIIVKPDQTSWGGYRGYFKDPDGFLWEVLYNPLDEDWDIKSN